MFWRDPPQHRIEQIDRNTFDDRLDNLFLQGSTHWDGFLHVSGGRDGFYGGRDPNLSLRGSRLGVDQWSEGILGRGVLVDVASYLESIGHPLSPRDDFEISVDLLTATLQHQGTVLTPGSILCVRTGWIEFFQSLDTPERERVARAGRFPGLRADESMSEFLWDSRVAALTADNPSVEVAPGDGQTGSLHRRSLVMTGLPFGELFSFGDLARHSHAREQWDFLFISVPLNLPDGVGSPANAIAVI